MSLRMQTNGTDPKATASEQELAKYILEGQKSIMEPGPDTTSPKEVSYSFYKFQAELGILFCSCHQLKELIRFYKAD